MSLVSLVVARLHQQKYSTKIHWEEVFFRDNDVIAEKQPLDCQAVRQR